MNDHEYFDGGFKKVNQHVQVYEFTSTLPANTALLSDLKLSIEDIATDIILKPITRTLIVIDVNVVCVPMSDINSRERRGIRRGIEEATTAICKKLKLDQTESGLDKVISEVCRRTCSEVEELNFRTTTPHELSKVKNIVKQVYQFASDHGFKVYCNEQNITDYRGKFSKYHLSKPDVAVFSPANMLVANKVESKWLLAACNEEDDDIDLCGSFKNDAEGKRLGAVPKDPIGQLLAGIDKTMADLISNVLHQFTRIITHITFYGLYFVPDPGADKCEVYKVNVKLGKDTIVYKGKETLTVSDAFNRVFQEMLDD